ncbi:MAG: PKD domain-containing protein [Flavobacteriales bacterium]|nr:PKD domain-containing protein [Flavobacteriales bacterium]
MAFDVQPDSVCAGVPFQFINQTLNISGIDWDFGDSNGSTLTNPFHMLCWTWNVPRDAGRLKVRRTGCSATLVQPVVVKVTLTAVFLPSAVSGCAPLTVTFGNTSTGDDFAQWNFGDNNTSGNLSPTHTFANAGTYLVQLIAENLNGCADTAYTEVVAFPIPVSAFTFDPLQSCDHPVAVQFTNTSQGALTYAWTFGNGSSSADVDPSATYATANTFDIQLISTNQYGCSDTSNAQFISYPTPLAAYSAELPGCATYPVPFTNNSENSSSWFWNFGDNTSTSEEDPAHVYDLPGIYDISLIAYGAGGCTDTLIVPGAVLINPTPVAYYTWDTLLSLDNALQFNNLSQDAVSWEWDFGDGSNTTAPDPLHVFPNGPGNEYLVCLVAINEFNCPDTICRSGERAERSVDLGTERVHPQRGWNERAVPTCSVWLQHVRICVLRL